MRLLVDQGNTRLKIATLNNGTLSAVRPLAIQGLAGFLTDNDISEVYISSVQDEQKLSVLQADLQHFGLTYHLATSQAEQRGLHNSYAEPERLGVDRWLAMLAVWQEIQTGFLLIDAGSALTLDWVDDTGQHQGGHIIPGYGLMQEALQMNTDRVHFDQEQSAVAYQLGTNTTQAVLNGCLSAAVAYLQQQIQHLPDAVSSKIYLTGGDSAVLSEALPMGVTERDDLVIRGLIEYFDLS